MPVWPPPSVDIEPELALQHWRVMQTEGDERHLVGMRTDTMLARVTSALREFDAHAMVAVSSSGRRYQLVGEPRWTYDTVCLWITWCLKNDVRSCSDVTSAYFHPNIDKLDSHRKSRVDAEGG
ncbi:hypothetical protein SAMN06265784_103720 [Paraburkholderia susongensis]|uniref:Uncharacterized protein n=1 Tax=Paraburkholderia susongensis TaxID=1515439 RepID=A0A1X7KG03_9BURK|nr:hypothetical protein SAMN06265784_103720 [Paraburkholderia susongensis]